MLKPYKYIKINYKFDTYGTNISSNCKTNKAYSMNESGFIFVDIDHNDDFIEKYDEILYLNIDDDNGVINRLPKLPANLEYLMLPDLHLDRILDLPDSILKINFKNNVITTISHLPDSLTELDITNNLIRDLPILPMNLTILNCNNNYISKIEKLPPKLEQLYIANNKLEELPELPDTLYWLGCNNNPIKVIPKLPELMRYLILHHTLIEIIPNIPIYLHELNISHTNVKSLPDINHYNIKNFCASYSNISELPSFSILDHHINININNYHNSPLYSKIENRFDKNVYKYIYHLREEQIKSARKISNWYLDISYNPNYKYCRKRVMENYDEDYEDKKSKSY